MRHGVFSNRMVFQRRAVRGRKSPHEASLTRTMAMR